MTEARTISVSIAKPPDEVYEYLANPVHLPEWSAFITAIRPHGKDWLATTERGEVRIAFTPQNLFRILDHEVTVSPQLTVHVPMRVLRNEDGSEVTFTVFRQPEMSTVAYEEDIGMVRADLLNLKRVLEEN